MLIQISITSQIFRKYSACLDALWRMKTFEWEVALFRMFSVRSERKVCSRGGRGEGWLVVNSSLLENTLLPKGPGVKKVEG